MSVALLDPPLLYVYVICYMFKLNDGILTFCFRLFVFRFRFRASLSLSLSLAHTHAHVTAPLFLCVSLLLMLRFFLLCSSALLLVKRRDICARILKEALAPAGRRDKLRLSPLAPL